MREIIKALSFSCRYHKKIFFKDSRIPSLTHVLNVCKILAELDLPNDLLVAALLHELPEISGEVTVDTIEYYFNKNVAFLVEGALQSSDSLEEDENLKQRQEHTIAFITQDATYPQLLLIMADKLEVLMALHNDYKRLENELWNRREINSTEEQAYYLSFIEALESRSKQSSYVFTVLLDRIKNEVTELFQASLPDVGLERNKQPKAA
jgi:(p)ppGpp synthase/HD superfamily hydrolase